MKTKLINIPGRGKVLCREMKTGMSKLGDIIVSPCGSYKPFITDRSAIISDEARRGGQGTIYRPIPKKPRKVKVKMIVSVDRWALVDATNPKQGIGARLYESRKIAESWKVRGTRDVVVPVTITLRRKK